MTAVLILFGAVLNAALFVRSMVKVWRFNTRMPALWRLLQNKGRANRVREVRDDPRTNVPANTCTTRSTSTTGTSAS